MSIIQGGHPSPLFTPSDLANLEAWYDARDQGTLTLSGSSVSAWADKSGNSRDLVQASAAAQPEFVSGAEPYIDFDGASEFMSASLGAGVNDQEGTWFIVMDQPAASNTGYLVSLGVGITQNRFFRRIGGSLQQIGVGSQIIQSASQSYFGWQRAFFHRWDAGSSDFLTDNTLPAADTGTFTAVTANALSLGADLAGTQFGSVHIHEALFFSRRLSDAERAQLFGYAYAKWSDVSRPVIAAPTIFDIFLIAGQSNTITAQPIEDIDREVDNRVFMLNPDDFTGTSVQHGVNPLSGPSIPRDSMGFAVDFGRQYADANPGRNVLLVQTGVGGTSFTANNWNAGDAVYNTAFNRLNRATTFYPGATLAGILWHQGEGDAVTGMAEATYAGLLDGLISNFRAGLVGATANTPVVVGGLAPEWLAINAARQPVQDAIENTPARVANAAYASSVGLTTYDGIHFDSPSARTLGGRYATEFATLAPASGPTNQPGEFPTQNPNLLRWFDAELSAATIATGVSVWEDLSVSGLDLSQADTARQPVINAAGFGALPSLDFDGANDYLLSPSAPLTGEPRSMLVMIVQAASSDPSAVLVGEGLSSSSTNIYSILGTDAAGTDASVQFRDDASDLYLTTAQGDSGLPIFDGNPHFVVVGRDNVSGSITITVDGISATALSYTAPRTHTSDQMALGALPRSIIGSFASMQVGSVLMYRGLQDSAYLTQLRQYFVDRGYLPAF